MRKKRGKLRKLTRADREARKAKWDRRGNRPAKLWAKRHLQERK